MDLLRKVQNAKLDESFITLSACDPLNLSGILFPGHRVPSVVRNRLVIHEGIPIVSMENGTVIELAKVDRETMIKAKIALSLPIAQAGYYLKDLDLTTV